MTESRPRKAQPLRCADGFATLTIDGVAVTLNIDHIIKVKDNPLGTELHMSNGEQFIVPGYKLPYVVSSLRNGRYRNM